MLSGWNKRVKIIIGPANIDEDLTDFPVLLYLSSSSGTNNKDVVCVFNEIGANRKKIAVTTSDGTTQCYVEIERWDEVAEKAWLWVKIPSISSVVDTILYLYYDSLQADNATYVGDPTSAAAQNVWDADFVAVYHFYETTGTAIHDSTSNSLHGTKTAQCTLGSTGVVGKCVDNDPSTGSIDGDGNLPATYSTWTVEAWAQLDATPGWGDLWADSTGTEMYPAQIWDAGQYGAYSSSQLRTTSTFPEDGTTWNYCVTKCDGVDTFVFWDGDQENTNGENRTIGGSWAIGDRTASGEEADGRIDEVRISKIARPNHWIKATYNTVKDNVASYADEQESGTYQRLTKIT